MGILNSALLLLPGNKPAGTPASQQDSKLAGRTGLRASILRDPCFWLDRLEHLPKGGPTVLSFVGKGGTAKTTSAVFIAMIAAYLDHRVWVLDLDPQASASAWSNKRGDQGSKGANVVVHRCAPGNLRRASTPPVEKVLISSSSTIRPVVMSTPSTSPDPPTWWS